MGNVSVQQFQSDDHSEILLRSTHNTRIERLWVEVGKQFLRAWRAFFYRLESSYGLQRGNKFHIWLLNELFLEVIDDDCKKFSKDWNRHSIDNTAVQHMSPNVSINRIILTA